MRVPSIAAKYSLLRRGLLLISIILLALSFSGCSVKSYETTETKIITFKTPKLRFNDLGYIRNSGEKIQVDLFSAGQAVERFEIETLICITDGCMSKSAFNKDYLSAAYPDDILQDILLGQEIFEGKEVKKSDDGFEQSLEDEKYMITYRVSSEEIYFKDRVSGILIRIKTVKK